ncbi:PAS domain-containing protein [Emcibacter sp.]|uniref:PAS domain-containing protein n=1 Tax=Emcibacter sp. TaxID=1979954 RepID=UPI002AA7340B|nr:PAS domain-containing protein [Emcibacter sp.]
MNVHLNRLARELANDNIHFLEDYLIRQGLPNPRILKNPGLDILPCQKIRYAYQYWKTVQNDLNAVPSRAHIRPSGLGIALGNICLLEPLNEGRDYRYRLYGSNIAHLSRYDLQGLTMSEVPGKFPGRQFSDYEFHLAVYQCCQAEATPYYVEYTSLASQGKAPWLWRRLTLPLADDRGNVTMLLNCLSPEPLRADLVPDNDGDQKSIA